MGLLGWLKRSNDTDGADREARRALDAWRQEWTAAIATPGDARAAVLRSSLDAIGLPEEAKEIEAEMLEGLVVLCELTGWMSSGTLPIVETGHRVVGADRCHFIAPASAPDDPAQPAGTLFLTSQRMLFAGGGHSVRLAWHAVGQVACSERDLLLISRDRDTLRRYRLNSFGDALRATAIAGRLAAAARPGTADL